VQQVRKLDPSREAAHPTFLRLAASLARTQLHFHDGNTDMLVGEVTNLDLRQCSGEAL